MFEKEVAYFVESFYDSQISGGIPYGEMAILRSGKRGGKSLYTRQQLELLKTKEVILIDGMSKSAAYWMNESDFIFGEQNSLTQSIKEVTLEPSSLLMKLIGRI